MKTTRYFEQEILPQETLPQTRMGRKGTEVT